MSHPAPSYRLIAHVLSDLVRRHRWAVTVLVVCGVAVFEAAIRMGTGGMGLALLMTGAVGWQIVTLGVLLRELRILPLSAREHWLSVWGTLAVVLPGIWGLSVLTGVSIEVAVGMPAEWQPAILSTLYCALFGAVIAPLLPAFERTTQLSPTPSLSLRGEQPRMSVDSGLNVVVVLVLIFAAMSAPFWLTPLLPLRVADMSAGSVALLISGVTGAVLSCLWTPALSSLPLTRTQYSWLSPRTDPDVQRVRRLDRLTGAARVLLPSAGIAAIGTTAFILFTAVLDWVVFGTSGFASSVYESGLLLLSFDGPVGRGPGRSLLAGGLTLLAFRSPWGGLTRLLRVLPMSSIQRLVLHMAAPFVVVTGAWIGLIAFHVLITGTLPLTLKPALWLLLGGIAALGQSGVERWGRRPTPTRGPNIGIAMGLGFGVIGIATRAAETLIAPDFQITAQVAGGLTCLAAAVVIHAWSVAVDPHTAGS